MENSLGFNPKPATTMHIDINSCFATVEQQANPYLRGKPIAVAAYNSPKGCILAPSVEAKRYGVKTGMRVMDGRALCHNLIVVDSDPWKYRNIHLKFRRLLLGYTNEVNPKSIDEFVLQLDGYPKLKNSNMHAIAQEIKLRIKKEIGDWLTVSIGISTNKYLAKIASGLKKPDGLVEINKYNFLDVYSKLNLTDLTYIKLRNAARLARYGIYNTMDFYHADIRKLKAAFHSVIGYYWYMRLRGWEIDGVEFARRSYGNSYSLPKPLATIKELSPLIAKLVTKMSARLRNAGFCARGVHLGILYRDGSFWHRGETGSKILFATPDVYKDTFKLLTQSPHPKPVAHLAVSVFNLLKRQGLQLELFEDINKKVYLVSSIDKINKRWGDFVITSGRMARTEKLVPDRIAFGGVKELEEFTQS